VNFSLGIDCPARVPTISRLQELDTNFPPRAQEKLGSSETSESSVPPHAYKIYGAFKIVRNREVEKGEDPKLPIHARAQPGNHFGHFIFILAASSWTYLNIRCAHAPCRTCMHTKNTYIHEPCFPLHAFPSMPRAAAAAFTS
jgi:hypothetical protein